jgi:hypothetical protein
MQTKQLEELVLQSLEHELGGVKLYETALTCAVNAELKQEWQQYLDETRTHVLVLEEVCQVMKIDPKQETPGRRVVRSVGEALVKAMTTARAAGDRDAAQLVACESVVLAETKDHLDWELLGKCADELSGAKGDTLKSAYEKIEEQEDEHLYHTKGWCRELWLESLGLKAVLPPPEERRHVKTAIGAARAEQEADKTR